MIDNWSRSKITSHLVKRCCICGGCYNLDYKTFEMGPKFSNITDECSLYIQQLKYATNFNHKITVNYPNLKDWGLSLPKRSFGATLG